MRSGLAKLCGFGFTFAGAGLKPVKSRARHLSPKYALGAADHFRA
jgi:hypothetical protein